jgi:hypothetical protein
MLLLAGFSRTLESVMKPEASAVRKSADEPPQFLGTWGRVYTCVLAYLVALILALYLVSRAFTY